MTLLHSKHHSSMLFTIVHISHIKSYKSSHVVKLVHNNHKHAVERVELRKYFIVDIQDVPIVLCLYIKYLLVDMIVSDVEWQTLMRRFKFNIQHNISLKKV